MHCVFPDYYSKFSCIQSDCRHNCCIGWEIDIDPDTAAFYRSIGGALGKRLKESIAWGKEPHFLLGEGERCPFLNGHNLCDIILTLGEGHLCDICADHPRFRNELPDRIETGLGLCCEAAATLILGNPDPVTLLPDVPSDDPLLQLRDHIICALQNREMSIPERIAQMLSLCGAKLPQKDIAKWASLLLSLERLDEAWTHCLTLLTDTTAQVDFARFDAHMCDRQTEYEQLLVYLIYRHFANAPDDTQAAARAAFAAFGYILLYEIGARIWSQTGSFDFAQQIELARLFSSEIEYSDENLYILLDELE